MGIGREGRCVCLGSRGHSAGVVFSGAVLHPEVDTRPRSGHGRGGRRASGIRPTGILVGRPAILGSAPRWDCAIQTGDRWRSGVPGLSLDIFPAGVSAMKYALVLLLLAAARLPGKDSCLECHSQMTGDLQAPAAAFRNRDRTSV